MAGFFAAFSSRLKSPLFVAHFSLGHRAKLGSA
jgi:hypothetical protein